MKLVKIVSAALLLGVMFVALPGCEEKGPVEKVGESIDNTVEKAGEQIEKAGDSIKEKTQK